MARVKWRQLIPYLCLVAAGALLLVLAQNERSARIDQTRREQCIVVDADHNRERAQIVKQNSQIIAANPKGLQFGGKFYSVQYLYDQAKEQYEAPRKTRPSYCDDYQKNPVKPYPPLRVLQGK